MFLPEPTSNSIVLQAKEMALGEEALVVFLGEKGKMDPLELVTTLNDANIKFFGGIFPGVIHQGKRYEEGALLMKVPLLYQPIVVEGLSGEHYQLPPLKDMLSESKEKKTAMILVDGLASNIASLLSKMYSQLGNTISYLGGGAGSLSLVQRPCLLCNDGLFMDGALILLLDQRASIGVRHGWQQIMGPFVATRTKATKIFELNWNNAYEVYREIVEADSGESMSLDGFFEVAKGYPFGIKKDYAECIVRDPIAVGEEGELICVGEVPENVVLEILKGDRDSLIAAAKKAASDCKEAKGTRISCSLVVDCISRVLFLGQDFQEELQVISTQLKDIKEELTAEGILTLGEIASYGDGFLEFFNKTVVVGILHD